jgi:hypothetical protein
MPMIHFLIHPATMKLAAQIACAIWILMDEKDKYRQLLFLALLVNLFYQGLFNAFMAAANSFMHWKYDYYLLAVDRVLGVSAAGVALALQGPISALLKFAYGIMLPMMIVWLAANRKSHAVVLRGYVALLIAGPLLYGFLPAAGPVYAFEGSWTHPPVVPVKLIQLDAAPINAFPSLHAATALFFLLTAKSRPWRILALIFFTATTLSTLTTGEHYVVDLVAGLTFGCFVTALAMLKVLRAIGYLAITVAWSLAIRLYAGTLIDHPALLRTFAVVTVAVAATAIWQALQSNSEDASAQSPAQIQEGASVPSMPSA